MVRPTIERPCCRSTAATVEESTPPDMATATRPGSIAALVGNVASGWAVCCMVLAFYRMRGGTVESRSFRRKLGIFRASSRKTRNFFAGSLRGSIGGRELAELGHGARNGFEGEGDFGGGGVAAETEADGSTGFFGRQTSGGQHVGGFDRTRGAGGAGRAG